VLLPNDTKNNIFGLAFSLDGKTLATADQSHALTLWNVTDHTKRNHLLGHGQAVYAVAYSPDGKSLARAAATTPSCFGT
jgi:WD40 repeat protein